MGAGQRVLGIGLAAVMTLSVSGAPTAVAATSNPDTDPLRELQAELDALFAPAPVQTPLLAAGAAGAPVIVTEVRLVETQATVTIEWENVLGLGEFEIFRDGTKVGESDGEAPFVDTVGGGTEYHYEVVAVDGGLADPTVGATTIVVAEAARNCDLTWTGAVDSEFENSSNWAPIGVTPGSPRAPQPDDHVCIDSRQNNPATATSDGSGVATASTILKSEAALSRLLEVADGDFTVATSMGVDLAISGGVAVVPAGTEFRLLTHTDGILELGGNATAPIGVEFGPGTPTVRSAGGSAAVFDVSPRGAVITVGARLDNAILTLDGPVRLGNFGDAVYLDGTSSIVPSGTGSTIGSSFLITETGTSQVDVTTSASLNVAAGAQMTVTDHQAIAAVAIPPQFVVGGTLTLTQSVSRLGTVNFRSSDSKLVVNGGAANDFTGLETLGSVTVDEAIDLTFRDAVQVESFSLNNGATVTVEGELDYTSFLSLSDATVTAPTVVTTGPNSFDGDIDVFGTANRIVGDVTTGGTIRLNSDGETNADAKLAIDGGLTLSPSSFIDTGLTGSDVTGRLVIRDAAALDGALGARITGTIAADVDVAAVTWGSATGTLALDISGNVADTTIEQKAGGVFVRRNGGGVATTAVVATGMLLDVELGAQIAVAWPALLDADRYEIFVDGEPIDETTDTSYLVEVDPGVEVTVSIVAIEGEEDRTNLGALSLLPPDGDCTVSWTGAIDSTWDDPLNWLPVSEEELPSSRVPGSDDDVCIDVDTNTPVVVDGDVTVANIASTIPAGNDPAIDVTTGDVIVTDTIDLPGLTIREGSLTTAALLADEVRLGNAIVDATTSTIGSLISAQLATETNDAELFGAATIDRVSTGSTTSLRISDLRSPEDAVLDLLGPLTLDKRVSSLEALFLFEDGTLTVESDGPNVLTGLTSIGTLGMQSAGVVDLPESITIGELLVQRSFFEAAGDLAITGQWTLQEEAFVEIAGDLTLGPDATLAVAAATAAGFPEVDVLGGAALDGDLSVDLVEPTIATGFVSWSSSTGAFDTESLTGVGADERELVVADDGISVQVPGPSVLSVLGFDVGDGTGDVGILLGWPDVDGAASYAVLRDGEFVTTTSIAVADVTSEAKASEVWSVIAIDDSDREIDVVGTLPVFAPSVGCDVAWTGAVGDSWHDPFNWAPVVQGGAIPLQAVPAATEVVCIISDSNLPVQVTERVRIGGLVAGLPDSSGDVTPGVEVLAVTGAEFSSATGGLTSSVTITDGALDVDGQFIVEGDLVLDDSDVALGDDLFVRGDIVVTGDGIVGADPVATRVINTETLSLTSASIGFAPDIRVEVGDIELDAGIIVAGQTLGASTLTAGSGENGVAGAGTSISDVVVDSGARLVVQDVTDLTETAFDVQGRLDLDSVGKELGGLDVQGADAIVTVNDGAVNRLGDITFVEDLAVGDVALFFEGDLASRRTDVIDGSLVVLGELDVTDLSGIGVAVIDADVVRLAEDPVGLITPTLSVSTGPLGISELAITGDLALRSDSSVILRLDHTPRTIPLVSVSGEATLAGDVDVFVNVPIPAGTESELFQWGASTGSVVTQLSGVGADTVRLDQTLTAVELTSLIPTVDALVAFGIELGAREGDPAKVSLAWPAVDGATFYGIAKGTVEFVTTTDTNFTVEQAELDRTEFVVTAYDDDKPLDVVGMLPMFSSYLGCGLAWTGAIDDDWSDRLNWTPVVFAGEQLPSMRTPTEDDDVCVGSDHNLPIQVTTDTSVGGVLTTLEEFGAGGLPNDTATIAVTGAELIVDEVGLLGSASVTNGTLAIGTARLYGHLTLNDGELGFLPEQLEIRGTLISQGTEDRVTNFGVDRAAASIGDIVVTDADLLFDSNIAVTTGTLQLDDALVQGGETMTAEGIETAGVGVSTIRLTDLAVDTVDVADESRLTIETDSSYADTTFVVAGRLDLPDGVDALGELQLAGSGTVTARSGTVNDLSGINVIDGLFITDNDVVIENQLASSIVELTDSSLAIGGRLAVAQLQPIGTSELTAETVTIASTDDWTAELGAGNAVRPGTFTLNGDLVLPDDGLVLVVLDELPATPSVVINGAASLDGRAIVSTNQIPAEDAEVDLIRWSSATGTLATALLPDDLDPDRVSLRQRDGGLFLVGGQVAECGDAPQFAGMDVEGCWVDNGDGSSTATGADNADGVAIGAVDIDFPDDDTSITIDRDDGSIVTEDADGAITPVTVSVPVTDGREGSELARISFGSITFDGLQIGGSLSFPLGDLLGFPTLGSPSLGLGDGGWNLSLGLSLPGILRTAGGIDLSIGQGGILSTDLSLDDLAAVFGEIFGISLLDIDWTDASTWTFDGGGLGGPSITGEVDFSEIDGGGTLTVRDLRVEDVAVLPDFDLTGVFTDTTKTWTVSQPPASVLREFGFQYTNDGDLIAANILLGDAAGESVRNSVATWGEWLDVDAFELAWNDAAKQWDLAGRLASPQVDITGLYVGDGDGGTARFEISIDGTELGPLATVDLDLVYIDDAGGERFAVSANIVRDGAPDINGQGVFTFDQGDLATANIRFDELVIGELLTIEDFRVIWNDRQGRFSVDGQLLAPGGSTNEVSGSLTFDDGRLLEGDLQLDSLTIGPIRFDDFAFEFTRTPADADQRITAASVSGEVRAGTREPTPVSGSIEFVDGEITEFQLVVGLVDLGGLAQIEDLTLSYTTNDVAGTATMQGAGQLVTSDGATDTPVLVELTLRDGRVVDGRIEADVLRFGRLLEIRNFELVNSPVTPGTCTDLPAPAGAQQWQLAGETTSNGQTTSIDGCLVIDGRRLVAGELELGDVRLGSLLTIQDLQASFAQQLDVEVEDENGETITINQTDMSLSATVVVGDDAPASFSGSMSFANGGLTAFELSLPDLNLMNVVRLRDVEFAYAGDTPWDDKDETSYRLRGDVVGENTTSSFDGEVVFGTDGEVTSLSIDAEEVDFGLFRIDVLSFEYSRDGDESEWAISGSVEVDGETTSISGSALFEDGRIIEASLDIEHLVIADLVVIDDVALDYLRDDDGSEAWLGSAAVTIDDKSNEVALGFAFDADGRLVFGNVEIARIKWSELLVFEDVSFTYEIDGDRKLWNVAGSISLEGEATGLSGFIALEAGRAVAGELVVTNLRIGELTTIRTLSLSADTTGPVVTWDASIAFDNDANTTGSGSLTWTDGRLTAAELDLTDLRFGPTFTLTSASLSFTQDVWSLSASLENAGESNSISFELGFDDGQLVSAEFSLTQLKFGEVLAIEDFTISYEKTRDGASWQGSATVTVGDRTTSVSMSFDFVDGRLITARIEIGQLAWSEAVVMDDVVLTFDRSTSLTRWNLTGGIIIDGETTSLSGSLTLDDGRLLAGSLIITNLKVGPLATLEELSLDYQAGDDESVFTADIIFTNGSGAVGELVWVDGRLDRATIDLNDIDLGPTFTLTEAGLGYDSGTWSFDATFVNNGNAATVGGTLVFDGGRLVDGTISIGEIDIAGFSLTEFALVLGDSVDLGGGPEAISGICDTPDPGGPGEVYGIQASFVNESGSNGTIAGRLRIDDGRIADGVLCASNLSVGGVLVIDDFLLQPTTQVAGDRVRETWSGTVALRNPGDESDPFEGSFDWVIDDGTTRSVDIAVSELRFSDLLTFDDVTFAYDRTPNGSRWDIGGSLRRPDSSPGMSGFLELVDGKVTGGGISITDVSFGNAFSLRDFTMTYVGRRDESTLPDQQATDDGVFPPLPVGSCDETPSGSNVPSGPPSTTGSEAYFRIGATVGVGDSAFGAAGSIGMVDGRASMFDVSISCMNFGEWLTLENVRIGRNADGAYLFQAGELGSDDTLRMAGRINLGENGRVSGGRLDIRDLSIGLLELDDIRLTLGQQDDGTSTWGAGVSVTDAQGDAVFIGGGSVQILDGEIIGGTLELPDLPLLELLPVRDVSLGFERLGNGALRLTGGLTLIGPNDADAGEAIVRVVWLDGELLSGSVTASAVELFGVATGAAFNLTYDRNAPGGPRWSGQMNARPSSGSPSRIQMGIEVANGRVESAIIGIDGDGDGDVDPPNANGELPANGNGAFGDFPLKGLHVRYCAADSPASFCTDVNGSEWVGQVLIELPTSAAPGLAADFTVRDGRFVRAAIDLEFNPGVMVFAGLFLESIGGALELDPRLRLCGSLSATVGSSALPIGRIEGSFKFTEEYDLFGIVLRPPAPVGCAPLPPSSLPPLPATLEPDYYRFLLETEMDLFPNNGIGVDLSGTGYLDFWTSGYLELGAEVDADFWGNTFNVSGSVTGSIVDADNVTARRASNNQLLSGTLAQLSGEVSGSIRGVNIASAELLLNTIGWSGCARLGSGRFSLQLGASGYWWGGATLGCNMGRVAIIVPGSTNAGFDSLVSDGLLGRSAFTGVTPTADTVFEVGPGEPTLGIMMRSEIGTPNTQVISPSGVVYVVTDDFGEDGPLTVTEGNDQGFLIADPEPGTWTVRQIAGSPVLSSVEISLALPDVDVSADLTQAGSDLSFDYSVLEVPGQSVSFVERNAEGVVINMLELVETPRTAAAASASLQAAEGSAGSIVGLDALTAVGTATGSVAYRSNAPPLGGEHELVAIVEQDGLPRSEVVLGTYDIAVASPAGALTAVTATATSDGATVTWEPPVDDGGRQITAYQVFSERGFTLSVDGDARSADLQIPQMSPGETLEVYVRAFTAAGPGDVATGTFVATSSSGPIYRQPVQPESFVVGSTPLDRPDLSPVFGPNSVPTPVEPPAQTPQPEPQPPTVVPPAPVPTPSPNLPSTGSGTMAPISLAFLLVIAGFAIRTGSRASRRSESVG